jgi:hypothetical protein
MGIPHYLRLPKLAVLRPDFRSDLRLQVAILPCITILTISSMFTTFRPAVIHLI